MDEAATEFDKITDHFIDSLQLPNGREISPRNFVEYAGTKLVSPVYCRVESTVKEDYTGVLVARPILDGTYIGNQIILHTLAFSTDKPNMGYLSQYFAAVNKVMTPLTQQGMPLNVIQVDEGQAPNLLTDLLPLLRNDEDTRAFINNVNVNSGQIAIVGTPGLVGRLLDSTISLWINVENGIKRLKNDPNKIEKKLETKAFKTMALAHEFFTAEYKRTHKDAREG